MGQGNASGRVQQPTGVNSDAVFPPLTRACCTPPPLPRALQPKLNRVAQSVAHSTVWVRIASEVWIVRRWMAEEAAHSQSVR